MRYYYCPTNTSTTGCVSLGQELRTTDLNSGQGTTYTSMPMALPTTAQNGTRYIRFFVDYNNGVTESNEGNNNYYKAIKVTKGNTDLSITATTAPATGGTSASGSAFSVTATLRNNATNMINTPFYLNYYYCPAKLYAGCTSLGNTYVKDTFTGGQSRTYTRTLTVPTAAMYGTGYIYFWADATNKVSETNEANNTRFDDISVTTRPDLYVHKATVPYTGSVSSAGANFRVRPTIYNKSKTSRLTKDFWVRYYYCPTITSTTGCISLGEEHRPNDLNSGQGFTYTSMPLIMPASAANGTRYIRIFVDYTNVVAESDEGNNNLYKAITVTKGATDLSFTASVAPASGSTAAHGAAFSVQSTLRNNSSNLLNTPFYVYYYYCPAKSFVGCTSLGNTYVKDTFASGQTHGYAKNLVLPSAAMYGTGYIYFWADATNKVAETDEANNTRFDDISVTTRPDLYVHKASVPYTGSVASAGASFTVRPTIYNKTKTSRVEQNFSVRYYYCPTAGPTGCVSLGSEQRPNDLNSGQGFTYTSIALALPANAQNGTRYIRIFVDESNGVSESDEGNNNLYKAITVTKGATDLSFSASAAPASGSTAHHGAAFSVSSTVQNGSSNLLNIPFYISYAYCPAAVDAGCTALGSTYVKDSFTAGQARTYTANLALPSTALYGTGYVMFRADSTGKVSETNEGNNTRFDDIKVTIAPDLYVQKAAVPFTGKVGAPGDTFTGRYTIYNTTKTSMLTTDYTVRYDYCPTNLSSVGCVYLGQQQQTADLKSGQGFTYTSVVLAIPASAMKGTRYIRARLDSGAAVAESNETNNDRYSPITVTTSGKPDLHVKTLTANATGNAVIYSATVCNNGGDTSQSSTLALFYNRALNPTCSHSPDHVWTIAGGLPALGCTTRTHNRVGVKPGFYLGWALSDSGCAITEGNELNNEKSVAYTVKGLGDAGVPTDGPLYLDGAAPDMDAGVADADMGGEAGAGDAGAADADMGAGDAGVADADMGAGDAGVTDADMGAADASTDADALVMGDAGGAFEAGSPDLTPDGPGATEAGASPEAGAPDTGAGVDAVSSADISASTDGGSTTGEGGDEGCDCAVGATNPGAAWLLLLLALALRATRRRHPK